MVMLFVRTYTCTYVRTYVCTFTVMSQLSDWKRAHMCTKNHVCFVQYQWYHGTYVVHVYYK
jgi:hypothetical protein